MLEFRIPAGVHGEPALEPTETPLPRCPICDAETDTFFKDYYGDIIGCDSCVRPVDAWDEEDHGE